MCSYVVYVCGCARQGALIEFSGQLCGVVFLLALLCGILGQVIRLIYLSLHPLSQHVNPMTFLDK